MSECLSCICFSRLNVQTSFEQFLTTHVITSFSSFFANGNLVFFCFGSARIDTPSLKFIGYGETNPHGYFGCWSPLSSLLVWPRARCNAVWLDRIFGVFWVLENSTAHFSNPHFTYVCSFWAAFTFGLTAFEVGRSSNPDNVCLRGEQLLSLWSITNGAPKAREILGFYTRFLWFPYYLISIYIITWTPPRGWGVDCSNLLIRHCFKFLLLNKPYASTLCQWHSLEGTKAMFWNHRISELT